MGCITDVAAAYLGDPTITVPYLVIFTIFFILVHNWPQLASTWPRIIGLFVAAFALKVAIHWGICNDFFGWKARVACARHRDIQRAAVHKLHACYPCISGCCGDWGITDVSRADTIDWELPPLDERSRASFTGPYRPQPPAPRNVDRLRPASAPIQTLAEAAVTLPAPP